MDYLVERLAVWEHLPDHPGIAACSDGRLSVTDGDETLILSAPAAEIWKRSLARKAARPRVDWSRPI